MRREQTGGFTLLESVVSLAIIGFLATLLLTASVSARRNTAARIGAEQFAGFLRETAALAVNGVKDPTCPVPATDPDCSRYVVAPVAADPTAYTRASVAGGTPVPRILPQGARFGATGAITFCHTPPTLTADPPRTMQVTHASGAPVWNVCVSPNGTVEVRFTACPPAAQFTACP